MPGHNVLALQKIIKSTALTLGAGGEGHDRAKELHAGSKPLLAGLGLGFTGGHVRGYWWV